MICYILAEHTCTQSLLTLLVNLLLLHSSLILPPSTKESISKIHVSQTFLSLTNFIEKSNNIYDIKCASYENIFYDESNDTNLIP